MNYLIPDTLSVTRSARRQAADFFAAAWRRSFSRWLPVAALVVTAASASAQIAVVDASDPTDPQISYDEDPNLYAPDIPDRPTTVYPDSGANSATVLANQYTTEEPQAITSDPDTYSLTKPTIYYTAPTEPAGPLLQPTTPTELKFDFGPAPSARVIFKCSSLQRTIRPSATVGAISARFHHAIAAATIR